MEGAKTLEEQRAERRVSIKERCEKVAELVQGKDHSVVWCHLNAEGDLLEKLIPNAVQVAGRHTDEEKEERLSDFSKGKIRVLVTKSKLGGFGLNWQHCNHMTEFPDHSFEAHYQRIRRCWRFGQKRPVKVDMVTTAAESRVVKNMRRKEIQMESMFKELVQEMNQYQLGTKKEERKVEMILPEWMQ